MENRSQEKVYYIYHKTNGDEVRITESVFKEKEYISFRTYWQNNKGEYAPTKKGVTIPKGELNNIKDALDKIK